MNHGKKIAAVASVVCGALMLAAWSGPAGVLPVTAPAGERACDFEIQARNTGTHDIYLHLYTSRVKVVSASMSSWRQLKIQNARVGANKILPTQRVNVNGRCDARREWHIQWREGEDGATQMKTFYTNKLTRASSSTGHRVLVLGDVGKW